MKFPIGLDKTVYVIPDGTVALGAFSYAPFSYTKFETVIIPNSVTRIGRQSFLHSEITTITIPKNVINIDERAFMYCNNLTTMIFESPIPPVIDTNSEIPNHERLTIYVPVGAKLRYLENESISRLKRVNVKESCFDSDCGECEVCPPCGCGVCEVCRDFIIEDGVLLKYVGQGGDVVIPKSVKVIGREAFYRMSEITSITIPNSVTRIEEKAIWRCENLVSVTIPDSVSFIGINVFSQCKNLETIEVDENNKHFTVVEGVLFNKNLTTLIRYPAGSLRTEYAIPSGVVKTGVNAFGDSANLISVSIPSSLMSFGSLIFIRCSNLKQIKVDEENQVFSDIDGVLFNHDRLVKFPEGIMGEYIIPVGVTVIGTQSFSDSNLSAVKIPDSVTTIGFQSFSGSKITTVTIPQSVENIGRSAFESTSLESMVFESPIPPVFEIYSVMLRSHVPIYVPVGAKEKYQEVEVLAMKKTIIKESCFGEECGECDVCEVIIIPPEPYTYGIADAMDILKYLARIQTISSESVEKYDFFGNGVIKIGNAMEILKHLARLDSLVPKSTVE